MVNALRRAAAQLPLTLAEDAPVRFLVRTWVHVVRPAAGPPYTTGCHLSYQVPARTLATTRPADVPLCPPCAAVAAGRAAAPQSRPQGGVTP